MGGREGDTRGKEREEGKGDIGERKGEGRGRKSEGRESEGRE